MCLNISHRTIVAKIIQKFKQKSHEKLYLHGLKKQQFLNGPL